jgi:hypothetical protein
MGGFGSLGAVISGFVLLLGAATDQAPAQDRRQECAARYKSAKADGTLGDVTWPKFFSRCMAELKAKAEEQVQPSAIETAPPAEQAETPATPVPPPAEQAETPATTPGAVNPLLPGAVPTAAPAAPPAPATATTTPVPPPVAGTAPAPREPVFPTAIAPAYTKSKPHVGRRKTCLDQYRANKATDSNGGLKWIEKGGGYQSLCIKRLKGES